MRPVSPGSVSSSSYSNRARPIGAQRPQKVFRSQFALLPECSNDVEHEAFAAWLGSHGRSPVRDAVVRNAIGFRGGAITAEAGRPVTCFYPPLYFGVYFFKRTVSFHC